MLPSLKFRYCKKFLSRIFASLIFTNRGVSAWTSVSTDFLYIMPWHVLLAIVIFCVVTGVIAGNDAREPHSLDNGNSLLAELQDAGPSLSSAFRPVIFSLFECMNSNNSLFRVNSAGF